MEDLIEERRRRLGRNLSVAYEKPLHIVRGSMQYLYDDHGHKYLDAYNNVAHVGHCHPRVVDAARRQIEILNTNTRYLSELILQYAQALTATLPESLSVCYFVNSGSESNELAIRLARAHSNAREMIVLEHAYHGNTTTLIDLSPYKHLGPGGSGTPAWVHIVPLPDLYRGRYRAGEERAAKLYAQPAIDLCSAKSGQICGFLSETLPSVPGQIVFPKDYLSIVYGAVREAGGVCIADEVQTGFGRIGTHFWGFEKYDVVPDIVVLGKPIGNGHPIGAVITTRAIADSFANGMEFFSTFGGNNVSCAIGLSVLSVVQEERLQAHADRIGDRLLTGLRELQQKHELIGDVRGSGLHLGVELVRDRESLLPAAEEAHRVVNEMRELGILLGTDGPYDNVLKIRPPMPFTAGDADRLLETLAEVFRHD